MCDHPAPLTDFNAVRYMGNWFEQQHKQFGEPPNCVQSQYYGLDLETATFQLTNSGQSATFGERKGGSGFGYCPDKSGQCHIKFHEDADYPAEANYNVVDTDYDSYSIVQGCGKFDRAFVYLMTREAVISEDLYNHMMAIVAEKLPNFDPSTFSPRDYQGPLCNYAPMPSGEASFEASFLQ